MNTEHLIVTDLEADTALADLSVPLAVRTLWQLLRESDVRLAEALALDVPDADLDDFLILVTDIKEGGLFEVGITSAMADLLGEVIGVRESGPVFTVDGRRLRIGEVAGLFRKITGKSVHTLSFTRRLRRHRGHGRPQVVPRAEPDEGTAEPA